MIQSGADRLTKPARWLQTLHSSGEAYSRLLYKYYNVKSVLAEIAMFYAFFYFITKMYSI